jgi:UrcA family protein
MKRFAVAALAALASTTCVLPAVAADARPAGVRVDLDGLDLTTAAGRAAAQARIDTAVGAYCTVDDTSRRAREAEAQCKAAVTPKVVAQLEALMADPVKLKANRAS